MNRRLLIGDEIRIRPENAVNGDHGIGTIKSLDRKNGRPIVIYDLGGGEYWAYEDDCDLVNVRELRL